MKAVRFKLTKGKHYFYTTQLNVVKKLKQDGWVIQPSELGKLL